MRLRVLIKILQQVFGAVAGESAIDFDSNLISFLSYISFQVLYLSLGANWDIFLDVFIGLLHITGKVIESSFQRNKRIIILSLELRDIVEIPISAQSARKFFSFCCKVQK